MTVQSIQQLRQAWKSRWGIRAQDAVTSVIAERLSSLCSTRADSDLGRIGAALPQELIYRIVREVRPSIVIETGVMCGFSSAFILAAMEDNERGHLYSIDLPEAHYHRSNGTEEVSNLPRGQTTGFAVPRELKLRWTLILEDSRTALPRLLSQLGQVDIFFHDSEHTYELMSWEFRTVLPYLPDGGILASDDVSWNDAYFEYSQNPRVTWSRIIGNRLGLSVVAQGTTSTRRTTVDVE